ncbi:DUF2294 domain-containing protein [Bremerella cremea]|uniref:DUF2294 domain-containing protein n=1 Tax=Bremerella cremea TaxID=1031537 RepID=UPI0031ED8F3C
MNQSDTNIAEQLAEVASMLHQQRTGHIPKAVSVVISEDTLVVTLHEALSPAERAVAQTPEGAAQVQQFHRQLFEGSTEEMRKEIRRITGRDVQEASADIETTSGTVVHAFTTGSMVQVFLLAPHIPSEAELDRTAEERFDSEGHNKPPESQK